MIYCNLKGGLGNMFFQIAAAKSFSVDLGVNCSFPNLESHLQYLNVDKTYNPKLNHSFEYKDLLKNLNSEQPTNTSIVRFPFQYSNIKIGDNTIIDGFFQSEKYFSHNRDSIIDFLNFKPIHDIVIDRYGELLNKKTTSVHVRRGDYVSHPNHHPAQTTEYFNDSINILKDKTETIIVFSDDIEWCKNNIKGVNIIYIDDEKDYIELYLMSLCDNNIISNSSFSWWGAWLNKNKNKVVIGPKKWFGSAINHDTSDILPESWIKL